MAGAGIHPYHQQWPPGAAPPPSTAISAASPPPILVDNPNRPGADVVRTIFITGLPEDVKEREVQNLLRWLPGYEASQVNLKGKKPMGFALFATAHQALAAKETLQNMVFDTKSKSVLHTDMAKKNLERIGFQGLDYYLTCFPAAPPSRPISSSLQSAIDQMSSGLGAYPWEATYVAPKSVLTKDPVKLRENSSKYLKLLSATDFFYAGDWDKEDLDPIFNGVYRWPETDNDASTAARFALSLYNRDKGMELEFKKLIRVNGQLLKDTIFFLTMEASDGLFYEAKVLHESRTSMKVFFVRVAHHYPVIRPEIQHLTGSNAAEQSSSSRQVSNSSEDSG